MSASYQHQHLLSGSPARHASKLVFLPLIAICLVSVAFLHSSDASSHVERVHERLKDWWIPVSSTLHRGFGQPDRSSDIHYLGPDSEDAEMPGRPLILVSARPPNGFDQYPISTPFTGRLLHAITSVHPRRGMGKLGLGHVVTSLWHLEGEDSIRDYSPQAYNSEYKKDFEFECTIAGVTVPAKFQESIKHYFTLECEIPDKLKKGLSQDKEEARRELYMRFVKEPYTITAKYRQGGRVVAMIKHVQQAWEAFEERSHLSACVAPAFNVTEESLKDALEWRIYHELQGVEIVHWYSRTADYGAWVQAVNAKFGYNDTFFHSPFMQPYAEEEGVMYVDQCMWAQHCYMRNSFVDGWLALVDTDEYLIQLGKGGRNGIANYLDSKPESLGSVRGYQAYWGGEWIGDAPRSADFDQFPRNAHQHFTAFYLKNGLRRQAKSVHRTKGIDHIWVHEIRKAAPGYRAETENPVKGSGAMVVLHSRRAMFEDVVFDKRYSPSEGDVEIWDLMQEKLQGLEDLFKFRFR